jgi:hypothetical protein
MRTGAMAEPDERQCRTRRHTRGRLDREYPL